MCELYRKVFTKTARESPRCKLCGFACTPFDVVDFSKFCNGEPYAHGFSGIPVYYYRCGDCECTFTEFFDNWDEEDFANFIYNDKYVEVDPDYECKRPHDTANEWVVRFDVIKESSVLDFGAGSGGFAEAMNARGFRFQSYDPYSSPSLSDGQFDIVTAFEVIEHSPNPLQTFEMIFGTNG